MIKLKGNKIKENLCYYDLRNPDGINSGGLLSDDEIKEDGYGEYRKNDCSCDNCFYGRTELAEQLLKYYYIVNEK